MKATLRPRMHRELAYLEDRARTGCGRIGSRRTYAEVGQMLAARLRLFTPVRVERPEAFFFPPTPTLAAAVEPVQAAWVGWWSVVVPSYARHRARQSMEPKPNEVSSARDLRA